jgi:GDP-L-fucose synthase
VDDLADACAFVLELSDPPDWLNVGTGSDVTIRELTEAVAAATGYAGRVAWDATQPDGAPRKLLDVSRLAALGWKARIGLKQGIASTYASFLAEKASGVLRA